MLFNNQEPTNAKINMMTTVIPYGAAMYPVCDGSIDCVVVEIVGELDHHPSLYHSPSIQTLYHKAKRAERYHRLRLFRHVSIAIIYFM